METPKNKQEALELIEQLKNYVDTVDSTESLNKERDEWFKSVLLDLKVGNIGEKYIEYQNSNNEWMVVDLQDGEFYFSHRRIWKILETKYSMDYFDIQSYLKNQILIHLNWNIYKNPLYFKPEIPVMLIKLRDLKESVESFN